MAELKVLVYGGSGALGRALVQRYKAAGRWVLSVDLSPNEDADANVQVF